MAACSIATGLVTCCVATGLGVDILGCTAATGNVGNVSLGVDALDCTGALTGRNVLTGWAN